MASENDFAIQRHARYHPNSGAIGHSALACNVAATGVGIPARVLLSAFVRGTMKNESLWRGTLVIAFAIGAGWIGYMGWPLNGLITRAAEQSNSPNRSQTSAVFQDQNCPGNDKQALMCHLVNEYRAKHGLKPVQLDGLVTREAQYWSDQLNRQNACWFLYHTPIITPACARDFQDVDFVKTQRAAAQPVAAPN